jgi:hypothetical protein
MKTTVIRLALLAFLLPAALQAQEKQIQIKRKALDVGVYDYGKVKKHSYKIYYGQEADSLFTEVLMRSERLKNSEIFGQYVMQDDSLVFFREEEAYEYCPELNYVMITGGHGFVSAYNLGTLEELFVNPSTYVYSPSGKYRFGTFEYDGIKYYVEIKEDGKYVPYPFHYGRAGEITGVYWADDETMYYLKEKEKPDGSKYWIGYSITFTRKEW